MTTSGSRDVSAEEVSRTARRLRRGISRKLWAYVDLLEGLATARALDVERRRTYQREYQREYRKRATEKAAP